MSTHDSDSGQPPQRARRLVLRKIGNPSAPPAPLPPPRAPLPSLSGTTRSENSAAALMVPATRPGPGVRRRGLDGSPSVPAMPRSSSSPPASPGTPPAAFSAVPAPAPLPSFASFGSSAGGTPLPNRTRPSLPPVVANLAAGQAHVVPPLGPPATSARKAGLVGATLGLTLVAMFVIGARIAYRLTPQPTTAAASAASAPAPAPPPPSAMPSQSVPLVLAQSLPPADSAPPAVREAPRRHPPAPPPHPAGPAKAAAPPAEAPTEGASAAAATANAAPSSSAASSAPADSATSLVPVIPSSPPPEVDPLVKAVLEDNK